jgi:citrate synthase
MVARLKQHNPLNDKLVMACFNAHIKSAKTNNNASYITFINALGGSGNIIGSVCSALLTIGDKHAPLTRTRGLLQNPKRLLQYIEMGEKVPGFGNSFYKDSIDPAFKQVFHHIAYSPEWGKVIQMQQTINKELGKNLYPNAAMITAVVAEIVKAKPMFELWLFITARTYAWLNLNE